MAKKESLTKTKTKKTIDEFSKNFMQKYKIENINLVPKFEKIIINIGAGEAVSNPKCLEFIQNDLTLISGQKPVLARAKKSIAGFKLREGVVIGAYVTLRGKRMEDFIKRLVNVAIPRIRDFKGFSSKPFDRFGNYTLGIKEQLIFTEIDFDKTDKVRGLAINFVTTAKQPEHAKYLLEHVGIPFQKNR